jgi:tyrosyl-tRNA synthetase
MLHQASSGLEERLATGEPIKGYNGFDPTGHSLHIGSLVPIFGLIHLQRAGGTPVIVVGGGTAMIGDPSGRSAERLLLSRPTVEENIVGIQGQLTRFLDFDGPNGAELVDNYEWLSSYSLLRFLRDIGKHLTVPYMLAKDSVQIRLEAGLSFTEFSYMLLQAADFLHLYRAGGVEMQMGGADQWGNITAGLELIRKEFGAGDGQDLAYALSYPLLTNESGAKFGKTAAGTSVWLDAGQDEPVPVLPVLARRRRPRRRQVPADVHAVRPGQGRGPGGQQAAHPETRVWPRRPSAFDLTARVHGDDAARRPSGQRGRVLQGADPRSGGAGRPVRGDRPLRVHGRGRRRRRAAAGDRQRPTPRTATPAGRSSRAASRSTTSVSRRRGRGSGADRRPLPGAAGRQEERADRAAEGLGLVALAEAGDDGGRRQAAFAQHDQGVVEEIGDFAGQGVARRWRVRRRGDGVVLGGHQDFGGFFGDFAGGGVDAAGDEAGGVGSGRIGGGALVDRGPERLEPGEALGRSGEWRR